MPAQREEPHGPGTRRAPGSALRCSGGTEAPVLPYGSTSYWIGMDHEGSRTGFVKLYLTRGPGTNAMSHSYYRIGHSECPKVIPHL